MCEKKIMVVTDKEEKIKFKKELQHHCISILEKRIAVAGEAMKQAQESANSEEKSSAGDKYETSRAMGQLTRDMNAKQLEEAQRDLAFVSNLSPDKLFDSAQPGSVVVCDGVIFFISLGLGIIDIQNKKVVMLSPAAPIAMEMAEKKAGDSFEFRGNRTKILEVY